MSAEMIGATGLAGRYATALFDLADSDRLLDQVAQDLAELGHMIDESADLDRLIRSPAISCQDQGRAMSAVLEKAKMSELTQKFIGTVVKNRRLFAIKAMIGAYQALLSEKRGEATAEVVSATPLGKKQIERIGAALKKAVGSDVTIDATVDESLLGGLIVKIKSRMVDSSLKTKLQQLRFSMKGIG